MSLKQVDVSSLVIEGIDRTDYPDFCDAYFSYGRYYDGTQLTDKELDTLKQENLELFYNLIGEALVA